MPARTPTRKATVKQARGRASSARAAPPSRLPPLQEEKLTPEQRKLMAAISAGPRGTFNMTGPFACYLHAPAFGELAQQLGAHCRYQTGLPARLTEFAILVTASHWLAHYEWAVHEVHALKAGVAAKTIADLKAGRPPRSAPEDERALYTFIKQLYERRRVDDAAYQAVHKLFGDAGMVEFVGLLGYYAMVAMTLNVFRMPIPDGSPLPFREPGLPKTVSRS